MRTLSRPHNLHYSKKFNYLKPTKKKKKEFGGGGGGGGRYQPYLNFSLSLSQMVFKDRIWLTFYPVVN